MTFDQCLAILRARWKGALIVFVLVVGSTLAASLLWPKQYTATASVVVDFKPDPVTAMMYPGMASPVFMATQVEVMQSDRIIRRVIRGLKIAENAEVREQWLDDTGGVGSIETWLIEPIRKATEVKPGLQSGVIPVSYRAASPEFAAVVANALAQAYLETSVALSAGPAKQSASFFDTRSKEARAAWEKAQARLSAFQNEKGLIATDERLDVETARLNELSTQAVMLQGMASDSGSRQAQARGASADKMQEVLNSPLIGAMKADVSRADARLQELRSRLGENHPQVIEARANIAALQARVDAETQRITAGVGVSNVIARQREADVRAALGAQRAQVLQMKAVRDEGAVLMRDVEATQRAFEAVSGRFNQTTLESQSTLSSVNLLNAAEPPILPSSPKILLNTLAAIVLGALLAVGGTLLLEIANRRVRSVDDVAVVLGLPLIGMLVPTRERSSHGLKGLSLAQQRIVGAPRGEPGRELAPARSSQAVAFGQEQLELPEDHLRTPTVLDRSIGDLIAESRQLEPAQVEQILAHQRSTGLRFGEAAIELHLATADDVLLALARQYHYPYAAQEQRKLSPELVALNQPFSAQAESFRAIRSQVMKRVFNNRSGPRRALAVVSPNAGDGKTYFAANLAVTLAQLGGRTLLIDADMRGPRQHEVFKLDNPAGLANLLSGRADGPVVQPVPGVPGLFLLPVGSTPPNPLELVERPAFGLLMRELSAKFDHVVVDTPAAQYGSDAAVIADRCGASLMITRQHVTRIDLAEELALELADDSSSLAGVVMNGYRS